MFPGFRTQFPSEGAGRRSLELYGGERVACGKISRSPNGMPLPHKYHQAGWLGEPTAELMVIALAALHSDKDPTVQN
jgi:hypothetical protein